MGLKAVAGMLVSTVQQLIATAMSTMVGVPGSMTVALATAYQASDPTRASMITINVTSSAALSLTAGTTNTADVVIGPTAAVAGGTGTLIGRYRNSSTGALTIGLNTATDMGVQVQFLLPAGWFFAVRQTAGTVTIVSAFEQPMG